MDHFTSGTRRFTIEVIRSGQPRPYADSVTIGNIYVEWIPAYGKPNDRVWEPNNLDEKMVKEVLRGFCPFKQQSEAHSWADPMLDRFSKVGDGVWNFQITTAFTD